MGFRLSLFSFIAVAVALSQLASGAPAGKAGAQKGTASASGAKQPSGAAVYTKEILPLLENYCYDCHAEGTKKGDFALDEFKTLEENLGAREHWYAVWKNVQTQLMPPAEKKQPTAEERERLLRWIETGVFGLDPANPDPGRVTIRRMNRAEYENSIMDLLGVNFDADDAFPADDTGYGFDTIGDVLTISPLLMEKYIDAAQEIVNRAVVESGPRIPTIYVSGDKLKIGAEKKKNAKYMPFAEPATAQVAYKVQYPGRYKVTLAMRTQGSNESTEHTAKVTALVNGQPVESMKAGWEFRKEIKMTGEATLTPGENLLAVEVSPVTPPREGEKELALVVQSVQLNGPLDGSRMEYPKEYSRVFVDGPPPAEAKARAVYARKILRRLAERAFRRPVEEATVDRLAKLAESVAAQPKSTFEAGIGHGLTAILASPRFLFRAEAQPDPNNAGKTAPLDEFALASRLSYFLWSSLPDEELLRLAREGKLRANLRAQVDRMLGRCAGAALRLQFRGPMAADARRRWGSM